MSRACGLCGREAAATTALCRPAAATSACRIARARGTITPRRDSVCAAAAAGVVAVLRLRGLGGESSLLGDTEDESAMGHDVRDVGGEARAPPPRFSFRELALRRKREAAAREHAHGRGDEQDEHLRKRERIGDFPDGTSLDISTEIGGAGAPSEWVSADRMAAEGASWGRESSATNTYSRAHTHTDSTYNTMESVLERHASSTVAELVARAQAVVRRAPLCQEALALFRLACDKYQSSSATAPAPQAAGSLRSSGNVPIPSNAPAGTTTSSTTTTASSSSSSSSTAHMAQLAYYGRAALLYDLAPPYGY